jgi:hypothetical protein
MEDGHHVLLLWLYILRLCLPPVLFVSLLFSPPKKRPPILTVFEYIFSPTDDRNNSMRYSRMLEESSFANRKADYFWLLFLSSLMLLVRLLPIS